MNARELIQDVPELDVLLQRCMHADYDFYAPDCFYMQAYSEVCKQRVPDFNPGDGHWYGASVCVAGGLLQQAFRNAGYPDEALDINEQIVNNAITHEIETLKGNPTRSGQLIDYSQKKKLYEELAQATEGQVDPVEVLTSKVTRDFTDKVNIFITLCKKNSSFVYDDVDFSSPVFENTELFLPFKEQRPFSESEIETLEFTHLHELYPFTAHLMHLFYPSKKRK